MSCFVLYLNHEGRFKISKPPIEGTIIGERDPEVPIEWKPGFFYINPISAPHYLFVYRADGQLIMLDGGNKPIHKRLLTDNHARTWFEIQPQPFGYQYLARELKMMIEAIPGNMPALAKGFLKYHALRLPPDLKLKTSAEWQVWLDTTRVALSPMLRTALPYSLEDMISKIDRAEFFEGKVIKPGMEVRIRFYQVQYLTRKILQLVDSPLVTFDLPPEVFEAGEKAVKEWALSQLDKSDKFQLDKANEELLSEGIDSVDPPELVIWKRDNYGSWEKMFGNDRDSINNTIQAVVDAYSRADR